ncbi:uncharacterized protein LOC105161926 isoform X3 [Sesamum indicum]|uniref:Uncharacterized protein LOC105161926 isoform X3 n=1 Tax=Sesamum indicum TaxID=4182 RepID=A0A8M8UZU1_SESIN|nr:uncharacterized protein LOC105161926 isoform X3 [Sesamum indicum]
MSIALGRSGSGGDHRIERPGFARSSIACASAIYSPAEEASEDRRFGAAQQLVSEDRSRSLSSSSTSSIGKNSDESAGGGDEEEVQSEYKGGPLDCLDALEEGLPIKKSISKFYCGKSKSFTSLSDAATCSSVKDIAKPENAYTRKRKTLLAFNNFLEKKRDNIPIGGISKRPTNSRSMLALAATMNCSETNSGETSNSNSSSPGCSLPPLPPRARRAMHCEHSSSPPSEKFSSWRSFSLSDLQGAAAVEASSPSTVGSWINNSNK